MDLDDVGGSIGDAGDALSEAASTIDPETVVEVGGELAEAALETAYSGKGGEPVPRKPKHKPAPKSMRWRTIIWSIVLSAGTAGAGYMYGSSHADRRAREIAQATTRSAIQDHYYPVLAGAWAIAREQLRPLGFNLVELHPGAIMSNEAAFLVDRQRFPLYEGIIDAAYAYARLNAAYTQYQEIVNQCERFLSTLASSNQEGISDLIEDLRKTSDIARRNAETVVTLMRQLETRLDAARIIQQSNRRRSR